MAKEISKNTIPVFEQIKHIYDPDNIMNPNKKVNGSVTMLNTCLDCYSIPKTLLSLRAGKILFSVF